MLPSALILGGEVLTNDLKPCQPRQYFFDLLDGREHVRFPVNLGSDIDIDDMAPL